jgi:SsrA-binding protein
MDNLFLQNRKARYDYEILEEHVAGIMLFGSEVKSVRAKSVNLADSYCFFLKGELWVRSMILTPVDSHYVHEPSRERKLLLKKKELSRIQKKLDKGLSIVVLDLHEVRGRIKMRIALARGKTRGDKRETLKKREASREMKIYE